MGHRLQLLGALVALLLSSSVHAQTVGDIAGRRRCSTAGIEGLSRQLAETQVCLNPDAFVRFAPHDGIRLSSGRVHPYMSSQGRRALWNAAASTPLTINSAFRTLADQYVLYHSRACAAAARPGRSNHQSGRAVDVGNYSAARSALTRAGCRWFGSRDRVHFDCPGADRREDAVRAFQHLWNRNNPGDRIAEDGAYGPQTAARLARTPAGGFASSGCGAASTCTPRCTADGYVDASCAMTRCGAEELCEVRGGAPMCVAPAPEPEPGEPVEPGEESTALVGVIFTDRGRDDTSGRIANATIREVGSGRTATSDSIGSWRMELPPGNYVLEASAPGHETQRRSCGLSGGTAWCSIGLPRSSAGTLRGVVYTGGISTRIPGATVRVVSTGDTAMSSTRSGAWSFDLPPGTYEIEASGAGYGTTRRHCAVAADTTTWCSIGMPRTGDGLGTIEIEDAIPDDGTGAPPEDEVDMMPPPIDFGPDAGVGGGFHDESLAGGCSAAPSGHQALPLAFGLLLLGLRRRRALR